MGTAPGSQERDSTMYHRSQPMLLINEDQNNYSSTGDYTTQRGGLGKQRAMSSLALKRVLVKASPGFDNSTVKTMDTAGTQSQII